MAHNPNKGPGKIVACAYNLSTKHPTDEDKELLRCVAHADDYDAYHNACNKLFKRHTAKVLQTCREILDNVADCNDAARKTFEKLFKESGSIRNCSSLASWLDGTASNIAHGIADAKRRALAQQQTQERNAETRPDADAPGSCPQGRKSIHSACKQESPRPQQKSCRGVTIPSTTMVGLWLSQRRTEAAVFVKSVMCYCTQALTKMKVAMMMLLGVCVAGGVGLFFGNEPENTRLSLVLIPTKAEKENLKDPTSEEVLTKPEAATLKRPPVEVVRVVDGCRVVLRLNGEETTVRMLGVWAPAPRNDQNDRTDRDKKTVGELAEKATTFTRQLLENKSVWVEFDQQKNDQAGETIAYLFRAPDGLFVNEEVLGQGYGSLDSRIPFKHMDQLRAAGQAAREEGKGLYRKE